jgi:predicted small lipoprotein YifL
MKKAFSFVSVVLLLLSFAACTLPKYPIDDPPVVKIDARLIGKWKVSTQMEKDAEYYSVTKKDDFHYNISAKDPKKKELFKFTGFLSYVDSARFLNVDNTDDSDRGYFFMRLLEINVAGNKLRTCSVEDTMMQYLTSPAQVKEYIRKHLDNPGFYKDTVWMSKVK